MRKKVIIEIECPDEETAILLQKQAETTLKPVLSTLVSGGANIIVKRE